MRIAAILVLLAGIAAGGWYWMHARNGQAEVKYRFAKVERGPIAEVVTASGTLNAVRTVAVGAQIPGPVKDIYADFNTPVKRGQVLARIDPASFELRVKQASADLDAAENAVAAARSGHAAQAAELGRVKATLADAQRDFERKKSLAEKNFVSPAELDKARSALNATREQLKTVEAQLQLSQTQLQSAAAAAKQRDALLKRAEVDLDRTVIRAPVDGTVVLRNVDAGQTVTASLQPVLFTIAEDLREMQIEAAMDDADALRLRVGMPASFSVEAFPRRSFTGEIRELRKTSALIAVANPDLTLLPGMTANVRVTVEERATALKVPNEALRFRPGAAPAASELPLDELKLSEAQRAELEKIVAESRQRGEAQKRIAKILSAEQRATWERLRAERAGPVRDGTGHLWLLKDRVPSALEVRLGLSDGASTELLGEPLMPGSEVIVGVAERRASRAP